MKRGRRKGIRRARRAARKRLGGDFIPRYASVDPTKCSPIKWGGRSATLLRETTPGHCRWCGGKVTAPRRRTWCGDECTAEVGALWAIDEHVLRRDGGRCKGCGCDVRKLPDIKLKEGRSRRRAWDVDHIKPVKDGGTYHPDNLQVLCYRCHLEKTKEQR